MTTTVPTPMPAATPTTRPVPATPATAPRGPLGMTTLTVPALAGQVKPSIRAIPWHRLLRVEWRKQIDTRASRWLLGIAWGLGVLSLVATVFIGREMHSFESQFGLASIPILMLVPVLGILTATAEWSQHTGLTTFALEPRRGRVVAAKIAVSSAIGLVSLAAMFGLAALAHLTAATLRDASTAWALSWAALAGTVLAMTLSMVQASAFGFVFKNTPGAIAFFFIPQLLVSLVMNIVPWLRPRAEWFDMSPSVTTLMTGEMTGSTWAHLASSSSIWVLVPLVIGVVRVVRSEVK